MEGKVLSSNKEYKKDTIDNDVPSSKRLKPVSQMLLAIERKKAKMSRKEKASGLKGKTYSKAAKPKKSSVAKNVKVKKTGKK